ncbi:MAG: VWA domain-containing protein [Pirellulales bacterium]|nr:VWA domain-containing protein [Pirellulales bacterium]
MSTTARCCAVRNTHVRHGSIIVLTSLFLVTLIALLAFAIDIGYIQSTETDLRRTVDAAVLAGAGELTDGNTEALSETVLSFIDQNPVGSDKVQPENVTVEVGHWDDDTRTFIPEDFQPSALRVHAWHVNEPMFFGAFLGVHNFALDVEAIAVYQPRDIVVVLDYSGSMNDDSEFKAFNTIGADDVKTNQQQIWNELVATGSIPAAMQAWSWDGNSYSTTTAWRLKRRLGISEVDYPFAQGSWEDWFSYVQNDSHVANAGYTKRYGRYTFVNYLLAKQPAANETSVLWRTSEQPITAVKDAVQVFLAYLQEAETSDRVGLAVYTASDGTAKLESSLTADYESIETISRQRQAAHYHNYTNIGDGIKAARDELVNHARPGAFKLIVLMTDGIANRPNNTTYAKQYAKDQAELTANARIPIATISLGANADKTLMDDIATATAGIHFNVPGGQSVDDYEEDLKDAFREIAADRPLKLVK